MFFYSKKSSRKIVHYGHCPYNRYMSKASKGQFETLEEARAAGYHLCKHCAPMGKHYRKEYKELERFARWNGVIFLYEDGVIDIETPRSRWKLVTEGKHNKLRLYHKNTHKGKHKKDTSSIPGYHSQAIWKNSILEYMEFILEHDDYRRIHPDEAPPQKSPPPMKGTKRYRKKQKKLKKRRKAESIREVLRLIEMFSVPDLPDAS